VGQLATFSELVPQRWNGIETRRQMISLMRPSGWTPFSSKATHARASAALTVVTCEHLGDGVRVRGLLEADNNLAPAIESYPAKRHRASRPTYVPVNFCGNQNLGPEFSGTDPGKSERPGHSVAE